MFLPLPTSKPPSELTYASLTAEIHGAVGLAAASILLAVALMVTARAFWPPPPFAWVVCGGAACSFLARALFLFRARASLRRAPPHS